jgi:hypothetical protein
MQPRTTIGTLTDMARRLPEVVTKNIVAIVITGAVSAGVAYAVNVWLMAVRYEGSVTPQGAPTTSRGNVLSGGMFWALFPMVACSVIGYRLSVGRERFWRDMRRLPMTLVGLFRRGGASGWVHLLWGSAIALVATIVVPPAVGAVLGVGLLLSAPSIVGRTLSSVVAQLWRALARVVAPTKDHRVAPVLKMAIGFLGWGVAFVVGFLLPGEWTRLVLALGCAAAAVVLARRLSAGAVAVALVLVVVAGPAVVMVVSALLGGAPVAADDGGFSECGSTLRGWLQECSGADVVRQLSLIGAFVAAVSGPVGLLLGSLVGEFTPRLGGNWWDLIGPDGGMYDFDADGDGDGDDDDSGVEYSDDWPPRADGLPTGPRDPMTGEPLVVNDGRWSGVPMGHVYANGAWIHPEAFGALPALDAADLVDFDDPLALADEDPLGLSVADAWMWLPPLAAATISAASSPSGAAAPRRGRRSRAGAAGAVGDGSAGAGSSGEAGGVDGGGVASDRGGATGGDATGGGAGAGGGASGVTAVGGAGPSGAAAGAGAGVGDVAHGGSFGPDELQHGQALVDEARAIHQRLDDASLDESNREQLHRELREKAIAINGDPAARSVLDADADAGGETARFVEDELVRVYDDVDPKFVERMNAMGITRGGRPFESDDLWDVRDQSTRVLGVVIEADTPPAAAPHAADVADTAVDHTPTTQHGHQRPSDRVAPSNVRSLMRRGRRRKKKQGKMAVDIDIYAAFLVTKLEQATDEEARTGLQRKLDRLATHREAGVTSVLVSPAIWNDIAPEAYAGAYRDVTGADLP